MTDKTLSEEESEPILLMAYILGELVHADGFFDMDDALKANPDILDVFIKYGSTALQTYLQNKMQCIETLRDIIIAAMNTKDGYDHLNETDDRMLTYSNYAQASLVAICRYRANPKRVTIKDENSAGEPHAERDYPFGNLLPVN